MQRKLPTLKAYKARIRKFKSFADMADEEFDKEAQRLYDEKYGKLLKEIPEEEESQPTENELGTWQDKKEAESAQEIFDQYKQNKDFTEFSDIEELKRLVWFEIYFKRLQRTINTEKDRVNEHDVKALDNLHTKILNLKRTLGLLEDSEGKNPLDELNKFRRKARVWRRLNRVSFEARCEWCSKMGLFKIRNKIEIGGKLVDVYDYYKHPFFRDKVLCNQWLWELYKQNKITKVDIAKVLFPEKWQEMEVTYYVSWLEKKIFEPQEIREELEQKDETKK